MAAARGAARDGVAALHNLSNLLRSLRVGAKPLGRALVDVRDGCAGMHGAFEALEREVAARQPAAAAPSAAPHFAAAIAAIDELAAALERTDPAAVDARTRLSIEVVVRRIIGELDGALCLADLLVAAGAPRAVHLDVGDVVRHRLCAPRAAAASVRLTFAPGDYAFTGDPTLAASLVEVALACAPRGRAIGLRTKPERTGDGRLRLLVELDPGRRADRGALTVSFGERLSAVYDAARVAARCAGVELEVEAGRIVVVL
jgi:hypothetical protein